MTRLRARADANQAQIVDALRAAGASVFDAHNFGHGFPDLVCGLHRRTFLIEVKDGAKVPSARKLTPDEVAFRKEWKGHYAVVLNVEQALAAIGATREETAP